MTETRLLFENAIVGSKVMLDPLSSAVYTLDGELIPERTAYVFVRESAIMAIINGQLYFQILDQQEQLDEMDVVGEVETI